MPTLKLICTLLLGLSTFSAYPFTTDSTRVRQRLSSRSRTWNRIIIRTVNGERIKGFLYEVTDSTLIFLDSRPNPINPYLTKDSMPFHSIPATAIKGLKVFHTGHVFSSAILPALTGFLLIPVIISFRLSYLNLNMTNATWIISGGLGVVAGVTGLIRGSDHIERYEINGNREIYQMYQQSLLRQSFRH